jgi:HD domain
MTVTDHTFTPFDLPDSAVAVAALRLCRNVAEDFVYNHTVRSYLFARELAAVDGPRDFDDELVFLACVLHDLGATDYANGDQRFEVDGADAAARFLRDEGVDDARTQTVWNAIALHTSPGLAHRFGIIEGTAQRGIAADVVGQDRERLRDGFAAPCTRAVAPPRPRPCALPPDRATGARQPGESPAADVPRPDTSAALPRGRFAHLVRRGGGRRLGRSADHRGRLKVVLTRRAP